MSSVELRRGRELFCEVPFKAGLRLIHAVVKAGGLTSFGSQKVILVRDDIIIGDYDLSLSCSPDCINPDLEPGDLIVLPAD